MEVEDLPMNHCHSIKVSEEDAQGDQSLQCASRSTSSNMSHNEWEAREHNSRTSGERSYVVVKQVKQTCG